MKTFIVFCIRGYYPCGGLEDVSDSFDSLEEARHYLSHCLNNRRDDWGYIVNRDTWQKVE